VRNIFTYSYLSRTNIKATSEPDRDERCSLAVTYLLFTCQRTTMSAVFVHTETIPVHSLSQWCRVVWWSGTNASVKGDCVGSLRTETGITSNVESHVQYIEAVSVCLWSSSYCNTVSRWTSRCLR